jgi:hypothetical protein
MVYLDPFFHPRQSGAKPGPRRALFAARTLAWEGDTWNEERGLKREGLEPV